MMARKLLFLTRLLICGATATVSAAFVPPLPAVSSYRSENVSTMLDQVARAATTSLYQRLRPSNEDETFVNMDEIEREVLASSKVRMDMNRVNKVLEDVEPDPKASLHSDDWKVALAAAAAAGVAVDITMRSLVLAGLASAATFVVANQNPLEEGDGIEGPLARAVGRKTIDMYESSKPKLKAVARAVITDEQDIEKLRMQVMELYEENIELRLWKQRRLAVDAALSDYTLGQLCAIARENRMRVGGTKAELLMRLVEAGVIRL